MFQTIGVISGTSMDGIDVALVTTDGRHQVTPGPGATYPYPLATRQQAFHGWVSAMAMQVLTGDWQRRYIERGWASGAQAAAKQGYPDGNGDAEHLVQWAQQELTGIVAVITQPVARACRASLRIVTEPSSRATSTVRAASLSQLS